MSNVEDDEFREVYEHWVEQIDFHQYHIFVETAKFVDLLKQRQVSAKTKNEILIIIKGLQATVKSVSKVLSNYVE
jgi:hypothetical protein